MQISGTCYKHLPVHTCFQFAIHSTMDEVVAPKTHVAHVLCSEFDCERTAAQQHLRDMQIGVDILWVCSLRLVVCIR